MRRRPLRATSGTRTQASSATCAAGRQSVSSATPTPTATSHDVAAVFHARTTAPAHHATMNANTGSLETSWKSPAYVGVRRSTHAAGERDPTRDRHDRPRPAEDRERVEQREHDLREPRAAEPHRDPGDERRDRRPEHLERRERRVGVRELEEREPVVPRVPAALQRPGERLDGVAREPDGREQRRAPA